LGPDLLLAALTAALFAGMTNLTVAFVAGIALGVVQQVLTSNWTTAPTRVGVVMFALILVALVLRISRLRRTAVNDERADWRLSISAPSAAQDSLRRTVGRGGLLLMGITAAVLPMLLSQSNAFLMSTVLVFALIAISLTILAGWAGQLSLGHMALVAVGTVVYVRLADNLSLPLVLLVAGAVSAVVAIAIGIPALRIPGLYLAVSTLGLALVVNTAVLTTSCVHLGPLGHVCSGLPNPSDTFVHRPHRLLSRTGCPCGGVGGGCCVAGSRAGSPAAGSAGQRVRRSGHGCADHSRQADGVCSVRLHRRGRRRVLRAGRGAHQG
jgi:branched-subunit amino acid ABC-type transport system permease component